MNRVVMLFRHLLSIVILPSTVAVRYCRHVGRILPLVRAWQPPRI